VLYRIVGEEQVRVMDIKEFIKQYVPWSILTSYSIM
jgi:hypothetical protein